MATVTIRGLTKRFGGVTVVDGLDLDVADGEFVTFLGPSGCGKTTTLRCIAGLERPDGGRIEIGGRVMSSEDSRTFVPPERRHAGMVFQSYSLWPHMTVRGNVSYPLRVRRVGRREAARRIDAALELVGLEHLARRSVGALSGGQQQRVALARALVGEPQLLLFDEPLSNLDAQLRASMRAELHTLHSRVGTTSIYVTHDQLEALTLSDRIVVMNAGRAQQIGTPREIYSSPANRFVAQFVGFENFLDGTVTEHDGATTHVDVPGFSRPVAIASAEDREPGSRVTLAIRGNSITVGPADADGPGTTRVEILDASYLGDQVEYRLRLGDATLVTRAPESRGALPTTPGDAATVTIPEHAPVILAPTTAVPVAQ